MQPSDVVRGVSYAQFETFLFETFKVKDKKDLPVSNVEEFYELCCGKEDFTFGTEAERLDTVLLLASMMHRMVHAKFGLGNQKICFISPTFYYAQQAALYRNAFSKKLKVAEETTFDITIPKSQVFRSVVLQCEVVFMHGADFSKYLPQGWKGRKVIQIFPDTDVPVDPVKHSRNTYSE